MVITCVRFLRKKGGSVSSFENVLASLDTNRQRNLDALFALIQQPSISAQDVGIAECAALEQTLLENAGLTTRLLPTKRHPMVYGERCTQPGKPTLLIYGHYDVQPPEPLDLWETPPFEPVIRDGLILARGSGDNKGQHVANICGIRAWVETTGELPVNVKVLLEGEEEIGSPHIADVVREHRDLLAADLVVTSDGPVQNDAHPQINYGVRGVLGAEIHVRGASQDLHSGNWGGVAPNAAWLLVHLLSTLMNDQNEVLVDGFYDAVAEPSPLVRRAIDTMPLDIAQSLASIGVEALPPPGHVGFYDRLAARPTMTINGLTSGYRGPGSKTVIPSTASAKLDMRLVPNQTCDDIFAKLESHVRRVAPAAEVVRKGSMEPSSTPLDHPLAEPVRKAVEIGFGREPIDVPLLGGSLPDYVWTQILGAPSFVVPYAQSDERNHAPNERFAVERFHAGSRTMTALIGLLAQKEMAS
ncbi:MAG: M20/M25/M40 family metallo-hydrolase [Planctomycetaceae bacterium]